MHMKYHHQHTSYFNLDYSFFLIKILFLMESENRLVILFFKTNTPTMNVPTCMLKKQQKFVFDYIGNANLY
jgi:hypothetical protein